MIDGGSDRENIPVRADFGVKAGSLPILLNGFWTWDLSSNRIYGCSKMVEYFGFSLEAAAAGLSVAEYADRIDPRDRGRINAAVQRAIDNRVPYEETFRLCSPAYGTRVLKARGCCQYDASGKPTVFPGYFNDLTAEPPLSASPTQTSRHLIALAREAAAADGNTVLCYLLDAALVEAGQPMQTSALGSQNH